MCFQFFSVNRQKQMSSYQIEFSSYKTTTKWKSCQDISAPLLFVMQYSSTNKHGKFKQLSEQVQYVAAISHSLLSAASK